jgi:hypothetical protein
MYIRVLLVHGDFCPQLCTQVGGQTFVFLEEPLVLVEWVEKDTETQHQQTKNKNNKKSNIRWPKQRITLLNRPIVKNEQFAAVNFV